MPLLTYALGDKMIEFIVIKSGLFLNIIGALMIAYSVGPNRENANQEYKVKGDVGSKTT